MKDADKTKEQLINELVEMRQKIADCEALETRHKQKADEFREYRDHLEQLIEERTVELKAAKERLLQEIDERKRVEETTRTTIRQLFDIINFLPDPIFAIDIDRKVTVWNRAIREMTGVHWKDIVGKSDYAYAFYNKSRPLLIDLILSDKTEAEIHEHVGRMGDLLTIERYAPAAYGGKGAFLWGIAAPLYDRDGNLVGAIESIRDITEQRLLQRQLKYLGLHDSLTGLYNRAYFDQEVLRLEGGRHAPVGIIVCDVNGLKFVNDTLGHEFGDNLLKVAANAIKVSFRAGDVVARIGGDEFAVILPNSDRLTVKNGVQRIRDKIARYNLAKEGLPLPLSLSVGFAVCEEASINMDDLFKEADDNMYLEKMYHKQSTRNAIVQALSRVMEARDFTAQGHAERVQNLVADIAAAIDLSEQQTTDLCLLAQFHDIGKIGIPDRILLKDSFLTLEETAEVRRHCEIGSRIALAVPDLVHIADLILKHHEWWNGEGYPLGLRGKDIPLECRIMAIADAYDAMTSDRPYRKALSHEEAVAELNRCSNTQFDPVLVPEYIRVIENRNRQ